MPNSEGVILEADYFPCHLENETLQGGGDQSYLSEIRVESYPGVLLAWHPCLSVRPLPHPS